MAGRRRPRTGRTRAARSGGARDGGSADSTSGNTSANTPANAPAQVRDPYEHARQICLRQLAARPRTRAELAATLRRKGVDDETAQAVLERLSEVKLVDDEALAESLVHSGHAYQGLGRRALAAQLRRRGVDEPTASAAVSTVDAAAEEARARELVRRKLPSVAAADEPTAIRRLVGLLARKGYPAGLCYRVVREELSTAGRDTTVLDEAALDDEGLDD
jgi:regulatory protein